MRGKGGAPVVVREPCRVPSLSTEEGGRHAEKGDRVEGDKHRGRVHAEKGGV